MKARPWLPPLLWAGVIVLGTSMPSDALPEQITHVDKLLHFSMYLVLAALLTRWVLAGRAWTRTALLTVAGVAVFGAVDEWHQRFIPGRSTELADWIADSLGGAVGVMGMALYTRRSRLRNP